MVKLGERPEENASNSESDLCVDMTTDDQLRSGSVVRRLSADDIRDRDDWRIIDDVEDGDEHWNVTAGTESNDTSIVVGGRAAELLGRRRDSAPEMSHAFGSDDGDRFHDDTDNDDNADEDSNAAGDDSEIPVAMAGGPLAAARWLFPAAVAAQPLGARMLPGGPPPQPSVIGRDSNVKLAAMENTDVAVAQFAENNILPADIAALNVVLWNLHQQQMFQMHLILQLQQHIIYATAAGGAAGGVVGGLPAAATAACSDPQRDATLPDVLQNNKSNESAAVLHPVPGPSAAASGFRDSLYRPLVPGDVAATVLQEKSADIPPSTTVVDGVSGSRSEIRSPVTYVSAPSVTTIPPMLAMMDMSLGRLEPPAKEGMILTQSEKSIITR